MTDHTDVNQTEEAGTEGFVDQAVSSGGAYDVIRKRLLDQGRQLEGAVEQLNQARLEEFGSTGQAVIGRLRVRTENNCVARDIVRVGDTLLFGYNVFIGLKQTTRVDDVFAQFRLVERDGQFEMAPVPTDDTFLGDAAFRKDFEELYTYYKQTRLIQLLVINNKLLAAFQIGERASDIRVFRWSVSADGRDVQYIDNRGERDIALPPAHDFEWQTTEREHIVHGAHPHVNILDSVFIETLNGQLTIKVEDNTEAGLGIYQEPVEETNQSLTDAEFHYADVGDLILLKVLPYREEDYRYFVFNKLTQTVHRIDALGEACQALPEDHGIIFPGGYYLTNGEMKQFDGDSTGLKFRRMLKSPNGEDVLYVFYEPEEGRVELFPYNLIDKALSNPIVGHGYALGEDGKLIIFTAEGEPTRIHPMQVWQTPFFSEEFASTQPPSQSFYGRIGNPELVRGISELYSIVRVIGKQSVSSRLYTELAQHCRKLFDAYHWLDTDELQSIASLLRDIASTAELVLDEFEKVQSIRQQAETALSDAREEQSALLAGLHTDSWQRPEQFVDALARLRRQRGRLLTIRELRYMDTDQVDRLEQELVESDERVASATAQFLAGEDALAPYQERLDEIQSNIDAADTLASLQPETDTLDQLSEGLDLLSELAAGLKVDDATQHTRIIDAIGEIYAQVNQRKAQARHKQQNLGGAEARAQFAAQFKLFSQSITNALGLARTPEQSDEQLSRLLVQLEELEGQFSDHDEFLGDILEKREEIHESFEAHRQRLMDERHARAQSLFDAASRILDNLQRRADKFDQADELNSYFAADPMVLKLSDLAGNLRELDDVVKADDIESRLKSIKEQAIRGLRDKTDIFEDGGKVIKLGPRHKFSVNTQEPDLTLLPREDGLYLHLTGTDYFEAQRHPDLDECRPYWTQTLESENDTVYRAEYLAAAIIDAAEHHREGLSIEALERAASDPKALLETVRQYSAPRYREGYEKGIHDADAAAILTQLIPVRARAGLLRMPPRARALAMVFWAATHSRQPHRDWPQHARAARHMARLFSSRGAHDLLVAEASHHLNGFVEEHGLSMSDLDVQTAADYLVSELAEDRPAFGVSKYALRLADELRHRMDEHSWRDYQSALGQLKGQPGPRWALTEAWLFALTQDDELSEFTAYVPEAVALINVEERIDQRPSEVDLRFEVDGLLGQHPRIHNQCLTLRLDDFIERLDHFREVTVPGYRAYLELRANALQDAREAMRLDEFKPRPLSSFVRNRLINEAYLPIIGDNLAKQMGTVGDSKRTDLMGLLMMISPPGYGKTTLMEYVANRLGLIFMKINCPSLGHDVLSLDPEQAPNATARQELHKLNLALEMGNNVMLYLDDIQHTHPEFLQKFISLCDGTRRIEGVWKGRTRTYDMRGKKFCVVMAGNPYTESGEAFKVPDMLANRADIYNLGDILGGMDEQFALSFIENCLTSNSVLAPLATRDLNDFYRLVERAKGAEISTNELSHGYSAAEIAEITDVLQKLFVIQDVVLKVNQQYILSAAQADKYRTEPGFRLQGSYRNMNKMAEKVSGVMNTAELNQLIDDHYLGEAQLLTAGAEENLLKLGELRETLTEAEQARWEQIKADFRRNKAMGGDDADTGSRVVAQLADIASALQQPLVQNDSPDWQAPLKALDEGIRLIAQALAKAQYQVEVVNQPVPGMDKVLNTLADTVEGSLMPLVHAMEGKLGIDLRTHDRLTTISQELRDLKQEVHKTTRATHRPVTDQE